jgi:predicted O-methyltransferase YrrM
MPTIGLYSPERFLENSMDDLEYIELPPQVGEIHNQTQALGFNMASEPQTGSLLRTLASSKPHGKFLEIGTGTGYGTAWILAGMDANSTLESVDNNPGVQAVAKQHLGSDHRLSLFTQDAIEFLGTRPQNSYDFIFADTSSGKFEQLELTLSLLKAGGLLFLDDLLPQKNWPDGHELKVERLLAQLDHLAGYRVSKLRWATGIVIVTRANPG